MATNRTLIATKNRLVHSLNNPRLTLPSRPSCPCHQSYRSLHYLQYRNPTSSSVAIVGGGARFSTSSFAFKPTTSAPVASPAVPSTPCSAPAVSVRNGGPAANARVNGATAAAVVNSRPVVAAALPFSYDPTGLSGQAVKKPSCDNLNLKNSFYRRKLPEHLVSFTSPKGKQLFREMLSEGYGNYYCFEHSFVFVVVCKWNTVE